MDERVSLPLLNQAVKTGILATAQNRAMEGLMSRDGMRLAPSRLVTGEILNECIEIAWKLNRQGSKCNATELGEAVAS